jgi:hypothetical protein
MAWTDPRTWVDSEFVTAGIMNQHIRDNLSAVGPHLMVRKTADESVVSSTALQNDDNLFMSVEANGVYRVEFNLMFSGVAAGDIRFGFTFPSGGRISVSAIGDNESAVTTWYAWHGTNGASGGTGSWGFNCFGPGNRSYVSIHGAYINGSTAGTLQLQWAQFASNATASVVHSDSTLWAVKFA